jgi:hypothetical protein
MLVFAIPYMYFYKDMRFRVACICLLGFVLFYSCQNKDNRNHLTEISRLQNDLDGIEKTLFDNEIDTIAALSMAASNVEIRIKNNYQSNKIDMEFGKKMNKFKVLRRNLRPLGRSFMTIKKGIVDERKVLENLKADIEQSRGDTEKYKEYIEFERGKVDQLRKLLVAYQEEKDRTMRDFFVLYRELDSFSMECLRKNQANPPPNKKRP